MILITTVIQIQAVKRVYSFLPSVLGDMRRETQIIKAYANHTILAPSQTRSASCSV